MSRDTVNLQRGDEPTPEAERKLKKAIDRAKKKGASRVKPGDMQGTPSFADLNRQAELQPAPGSSAPPPTTLSDGTAKGLAEMARRAEIPDPALEDEDEDGTPEPEPEPYKTEETRMKEAIEARIKPIDIGQFLMNGTVSQTVPIIDTDTARLSVVFQTAKEVLEVYIDARLAEEAAEIRSAREGGTKYDVEMSQREYVRRQNEWALAAHIRSFQGSDWPAPVKSGGDVDPDAMQIRLRKVRALPSPLFAMITQNLGWFINRVGNSLTSAALGNG